MNNQTAGVTLADESVHRAQLATILVAEDSPIQAELLRRLLVQAGYRVAVAKDGAEGLALAHREKPAVVVSDINMPVMNGFAMCQAIRRDEALQDIPVIMLTALSDPHDVIHGLNAGADSYVTKPYDEHFLLSRIEAALAEPHRADDEQIEMNVTLDGEVHHVIAGRRQTLNLLVSTYGNAVLQNRELITTQDALKTLNEHLEEVVVERTAALNAEIAEHKVARQQLEQQLDELRRFNKASIGREARMKDLFDENQALRERLLLGRQRGE